MACAHAKFTGEVGVCLATSGPGAIHLLNGLYDAKLDHQPVVAIVGQQARAGARRQLPAGGRPAVAVQGRRARVRADGDDAGADAATSSTARAHRAGRAHGRPASSSRTTCRSSRRSSSRRTSTAPCTPASATAPPRVVPRDADLRRAAEVLNAGERVAILVGAGRAARRRRGDRGRRAARRRRRQGAARQGGAARRPAVRHRLDRPARHQAELGADAGLRHAADGRLELPLLRVPARGGPGARRADRHRRRACSASATRWRSTSSATARETLRALLPLLERKTDRALAEQIEASVARLVAADRERARRADADPINPQRVFWELSPRLPDDVHPHRRLGLRRRTGSRATCRLRRGMMASLSGTLATMGRGVPVRDRGEVRATPTGRSIALVGDGAMQMNGINELITIAKYWRALERPAADRAGAEQPRPEQGHLGAARAGGRPEVRGVAGRCPTSPTRATPSCSACSGIRVDAPDAGRRRVGRRRSLPTARSCSRRSPIPTCRRCRRTSRFEQAQALRQPRSQGRPARRGR